jgi:curved DNA-binding protein CbpA
MLRRISRNMLATRVQLSKRSSVQLSKRSFHGRPDTTKDLYGILGLPSNAPYEQVKKKYLELAKLEHPDVSSNPKAAEKMAELTEAYEVLGDQQSRENYDRLAIIAKSTGKIPAFLFAAFLGLVAWHFKGARERKKIRRVGGVALSAAPAANIKTWQKLDSRPLYWGSTAHLHTAARASRDVGYTRTTMIKHGCEEGESAPYIGAHMIRVIPLNNTAIIASTPCKAQVETIRGDSISLELPGLTTSLEEIEAAAIAKGWSADDLIEHIILSPTEEVSTDGNATSDHSGVVSAASAGWEHHKADLRARPYRKAAARAAYMAALDADSARDRGEKAVKRAKLKAVARELKDREAKAIAALEGSVGELQKKRRSRLSSDDL